MCRPWWKAAIPDFTLDAWTGVVAPHGTPEPIVAKLNAAINKGLKTAEAKTALDRFSSLAKASTPQEFGAFIADQAEALGRAGQARRRQGRVRRTSIRRRDGHRMTANEDMP